MDKKMNRKQALLTRCLPKREKRVPFRYQETPSSSEGETNKKQRRICNQQTLEMTKDDIRTAVAQRSHNTPQNIYSTYEPQTSTYTPITSDTYTQYTPSAPNVLYNIPVPSTSTFMHQSEKPAQHPSQSQVTHIIQDISRNKPHTEYAHTQSAYIHPTHESYIQDTYTYTSPRKDARTAEQEQISSDFQKINERLGRIEQRMERMEQQTETTNTLLRRLVQTTEHKKRAVQKPASFPMSTMEQMNIFEGCDGEEFKNTVDYLIYIGGFCLKDAINNCYKEAISDSLSDKFTWLGKDEKKPMCNLNIVKAIYEATCGISCKNESFPKPSKSEFEDLMKSALRNAKERLRQSKRKEARPPVTSKTTSMWQEQKVSEEEEEEEA